LRFEVWGLRFEVWGLGFGVESEETHHPPTVLSASSFSRAAGSRITRPTTTLANSRPLSGQACSFPSTEMSCRALASVTITAVTQASCFEVVVPNVDAQFWLRL